jgi:hypothetical protein
MICSSDLQAAIAKVELEVRRQAERNSLAPEIANDGEA